MKLKVGSADPIAIFAAKPSSARRPARRAHHARRRPAVDAAQAICDISRLRPVSIPIGSRNRHTPMMFLATARWAAIAPTRLALGDMCRTASSLRITFRHAALASSRSMPCVSQGSASLSQSAFFAESSVCPSCRTSATWADPSALGALQPRGVGPGEGLPGEYIPHLRERFVHPAVVRDGLYCTPQEAGCSSDLRLLENSRYAAWTGD